MDIIRTIAEKHNVSLPESSVRSLASILERREYQRDELILEQGQVSHHMYMVEEGMIRQFYYKDGRDITEHFTHEGHMATCIESLYLSEPTRLMVEAIEPSIIHLFDYAGWKNLCKKDNNLLKLYEQAMENNLVISQQKADSWRFETAHERYERFCREYPEAAKRASLGHIASYLLMTPETLSRVRAGGYK